MIDEATKKDLINIMKISSGFDGRNRQILRKIVEIGETTSHFKSALGQKFIRRAKELLADPTQKRRCLICQKMLRKTAWSARDVSVSIIQKALQVQRRKSRIVLLQGQRILRQTSYVY